MYWLIIKNCSQGEKWFSIIMAAVDEGFAEEISDDESDYGSIPELESVPGSIETDEGNGEEVFGEEEEEAGADVEEEEDPDTEGILEEDIDLVMRHANATKGKAVRALKNNDNDVINAILEIEMAFGLS